MNSSMRSARLKARDYGATAVSPWSPPNAVLRHFFVRPFFGNWAVLQGAVIVARRRAPPFVTGTPMNERNATMICRHFATTAALILLASIGAAHATGGADTSSPVPRQSVTSGSAPEEITEGISSGASKASGAVVTDERDPGTSTAGTKAPRDPSGPKPSAPLGTGTMTGTASGAYGTSTPSGTVDGGIGPVFPGRAAPDTGAPGATPSDQGR